MLSCRDRWVKPEGMLKITNVGSGWIWSTGQGVQSSTVQIISLLCDVLCLVCLVKGWYTRHRYPHQCALLFLRITSVRFNFVCVSMFAPKQAQVWIPRPMTRSASSAVQASSSVQITLPDPFLLENQHRFLDEQTLCFRQHLMLLHIVH